MYRQCTRQNTAIRTCWEACISEWITSYRRWGQGTPLCVARRWQDSHLSLGGHVVVLLLVLLLLEGADEGAQVPGGGGRDGGLAQLELTDHGRQLARLQGGGEQRQRLQRGQGCCQGLVSIVGTDAYRST